jgi:hypothetical protein
MKRLAISAIFAISSVAQAGFPQLASFQGAGESLSCEQNLTENYNKTSTVFQITGLDVAFGHRDSVKLKIEAYASALSVSLGSVNCTEAILGLSPGRLDVNGCRLIRNGRQEIEVCVLNSSLGLFTVTQDYSGDLNVIFTAWD